MYNVLKYRKTFKRLVAVAARLRLFFQFTYIQYCKQNSWNLKLKPQRVCAYMYLSIKRIIEKEGPYYLFFCEGQLFTVYMVSTLVQHVSNGVVTWKCPLRQNNLGTWFECLSEASWLYFSRKKRAKRHLVTITVLVNIFLSYIYICYCIFIIPLHGVMPVT